MQQENQQENKANSKQNKVEKWAIFIILLIIFPPFGLCYIWKSIKYFQKYLPLLLLFFGGFYFVKMYIALTQWLPSFEQSLERVDMVMPQYVSFVFIVLALLSIFCVVLAFITNAKLKSLQTLPSVYINTALVSLLVLSISAYIVSVLVSNFVRSLLVSG